ENPNQPVRVLSDVVGDLGVRNPETRQPRLPAEHHRLGARLGGGVIFLPPHREIHLDVPARAAGLPAEVLREMVRVPEVVAMYVDQHASAALGSPQSATKDVDCKSDAVYRALLC